MRKLPLLVLMGLTASPSLLAQGRLAWNEAPAVGSWAEFTLTSVKGSKTSTGAYRVKCLGRARVGEVDHLWIEIVRDKGSKTRTFKFLLPESEVATSDTPLRSAVEMIYQESGKSALRAEGSQLSALLTILEAIEGDTPLTYQPQGREKIVLPNGTEAQAFRKSGAGEVTLPGREPTAVESDLWVVREVPFGVAKRTVTTTEGTGATALVKIETLELTDWGTTGAKSEIQGTVKPFSLMELF